MKRDELTLTSMFLGIIGLQLFVVFLLFYVPVTVVYRLGRFTVSTRSDRDKV
jgi:pilus assembly protein TadC